MTEMKFRFKKPKHGSFFHYCGDCANYVFLRQIGCSYDGMCYAIDDMPTPADAYDKPCGLWVSDKIKGRRSDDDKR